MKFLYRLTTIALLILGLLAASLPASAQIPPPQNPEEALSEAYTGTSYSPYAGRDFPTFPLWGDTHLQGHLGPPYVRKTRCSLRAATKLSHHPG